MRDIAERPLRRDAERNRHRILEAAREVFAARGFSASFEEIARQADVAVGTVYRRFPDRQTLVDALFEDRMGEMVAIFDRAEQAPDGWTGFTGAIEAALEHLATDRALWELMMSDDFGGRDIARCRDEIPARAERLFRRAQEEGSLRADLEPSDVSLIHLMLGSLVDATRDLDPDIWRRHLTIVLDGLRAKPKRPTALPVPAMSDECAHQAKQAAVLKSSR